MGFLAGKRALIVGVATDRSIAWGIAQAMHREGAELAFTYLNDKMKERVALLAESVGSKITMPLDVTKDEEIDSAFAQLAREWGSLDILVHAVAFAPREAISGSFVDNTTRENFRIAHDISSYSLTALARAAEPLMAGRAGALLTLSYLGAVRSIPNYNVMGVAKASLEANVRFLAADVGPRAFASMGFPRGRSRRWRRRVSPVSARLLKSRSRPIRRNVTPEDVGNAAAFLCSDLAAGITGEILYVDNGFNTWE